MIEAGLPIYMPEYRVKRVATRLKKFLRKSGVDISHLEALDVAVQILGFDDWPAFRNRDLDVPLSPFDEQLSDDDFLARDDFHTRALAEAGLAQYARQILDWTNPTGSRPGKPMVADEGPSPASR
jgi:hypothetical protein